MDDRTLDARLEQLERRLTRLEGKFGLGPLPPPVPPTPRTVEREMIAAIPVQPLIPREVSHPVAPAFPVTDAPKPLPLRVETGPTLEQTIGLKLAGWAGAIVVVIAAAFGIKFAVDQGWFGALPPGARLAFMSLGGFGLLALGEIVYRRMGATAAAALFGAGVATLFVVSYAGHAFYSLYPRDTAFILMGVTALVGAAVSMRGRLVSIAVLSILGGNIAPLILANDAPRVVPFLTYLLMLQGVALFLAAWGREGKWWTLRGLSFATLFLWVTTVMQNTAATANPYGPVLWFCIVYAALFQVELIVSARRHAVASTPSGGGATFSTAVTAALMVAILCLFWNEPRIVRGAWTVGLAAACGLTGLALSRRDLPIGLANLSLAFRVQAAALLMAAVPVTLSGVWVALVWCAFAAAFAVLGAALDLAVSRRAAVGVWWLAVLFLAAWVVSPIGWWGGGPSPSAALLRVMGTTIPTWAGIAAILAVVGHAVAALVHENWTAVALAPANLPVSGGGTLAYESRASRPVRRDAALELALLAALVSLAADALWVGAALVTLPTLGATTAVVAGALALLATGRIAKLWSAPGVHGAVLLAFAAVKWLGYDTLQRRFLPGWSPTESPVLLNAAVAVGLLLVGSVAALRWLRPTKPAADGPGPTPEFWRSFSNVMSFAAVLIGLWIGTMEIDRFFQTQAAIPSAASFADPRRAEYVALSIFWSAFAVGCVVAGFRLRAAPLRYFGLGLFAVTLGKVFLVDLNDVGTGYRILSLLGLGTLLIGTSLLYARLSPILLRGPAQPDAVPEG